MLSVGRGWSARWSAARQDCPCSMSSLSMFAKESVKQPMFTVQSGNRTETGAKINDIVSNYVSLHGFLLFWSKGSLEINRRVFIENRQTRFLNKLFVSIILTSFHGRSTPGHRTSESAEGPGNAPLPQAEAGKVWGMWVMQCSLCLYSSDIWYYINIFKMFHLTGALCMTLSMRESQSIQKIWVLANSRSTSKEYFSHPPCMTVRQAACHSHLPIAVACYQDMLGICTRSTLGI